MSLHLQRDLDKLKKEILKLGNLVETAINNAILALNNREAAYVDEVFKQEEIINDMEVKIEEDVLKILALHQPVAGDLRFIVVSLKVNNDLERMGDFDKNIAKRAREYAVQPIAGAVREQFRRVFAGAAGGCVGQRGAVAYGYQVARAQEDVRLAEGQLAGDQLRGLYHDEQRVAVGLDLGALVGVVGILDGEVVQVELFLQLFQQRFVRLVQADPDEAVVLGQHVADRVQRDIADTAAVAVVGDAVDHHAGGLQEFRADWSDRLSHLRMMPLA